MKNEKRKMELVNLIAESFVDDLYDWIHSQDINCYAFARGLTYPDPAHKYYAPGKIYNLKFGVEEAYVRDEYNPEFIDKCIAKDTFALNQNCKRVSFDQIKDDDGYFYFGITDFHVLGAEDDHHWHFICRTETGLWLHKPNWYQDAFGVDWIKFGKTFRFYTLTHGALVCNKNIIVPCIGSCFENYFYRLKLEE